MNPKNEEYYEAMQSEVTNQLNEAKAIMSKENQAKFDAVEKAVRILVDAKVLFYMFPYLPYPDCDGEKGCYQWNDLIEVLGFEKNGKFSDESLDTIQKVNESLLYSVFNQFTRSVIGTLEKEDEGPEMFKERFRHFGELLLNSFFSTSKRLAGEK